MRTNHTPERQFYKRQTRVALLEPGNGALVLRLDKAAVSVQDAPACLNLHVRTDQDGWDLIKRIGTANGDNKRWLLHIRHPERQSIQSRIEDGPRKINFIDKDGQQMVSFDARISTKVHGVLFMVSYAGSVKDGFPEGRLTSIEGGT